MSVSVMKTLRSDLDLPFYRERVRQCLELAQMSRSVPPIKSRLEALAQLYQQRIDDLERGTEQSPPLAPDQRSDDPNQLISDTVSAHALHHSD
jgi:hypothetical protein